MKFYRHARDIPTDPVDRRNLIKWVMNHKVWTHPTTIRIPPSGDIMDSFVPSEKFKPHYEMLTDGPGWTDEVIDAGDFYDCVSIEFAYVDPETRRVEDDDTRNTLLEMWIEAGPWMDLSETDLPPTEGWNDYNKWVTTHDMNLDCGGATMEEALLQLAVRIEFYYKYDGTSRPYESRCKGTFEDEDLKVYKSGCTPDADGYCVRCNYRCK